MTICRVALICSAMQIDSLVQEVPASEGKAKQREVGRKEASLAKCVLGIIIGAMPRAE